MHNKRSNMPTAWPLPRKGETYFTVASHANTTGIPLLIVLRDVLKIAETRKEARMMILNGDVIVNQKIRKIDNYPVRPFDVLTLEKSKKNYRLNIVGKRYKFEEVSGKEAEKKTVKIIGKILMPKKQIQMNLDDGTNMFVKESFSVGDSAVISLKDNKLEKVVALKEGVKILIVSGKHAGKDGKLKGILTVNGRKEYSIKLDEGEVVLPLKTILALN